MEFGHLSAPEYHEDLELETLFLDINGIGDGGVHTLTRFFKSILENNE